MKLRILNNTVRFRMSQDEIKQLAAGNEISTITHFITDSLLVVLRTSSSQTNIDLVKNKLLINLSAEQVKKLAENDSEVGFTFRSGSVEVLFEKDYKCLTDRGEDESDLYENPRTSH